MNSEDTKKSKFSALWRNSYVRLFTSVLVLFAGILAFLPSAGVLRSFPILILLSGVSGLIYKDKRVLFGFSFVLSLCMYCTGGYSLYYSIGFSVLSAIFTLLGLLIFNRAHLAVKSTKKQSKAKFVYQLSAFTLVSFIVYFIACGNPYSAVISDRENRAYVRESYGDTVKVQYTYFSLPEFDFRTCAEFADGEILIGRDKECYVMMTSSGIRDGIRDYAEEKLLTDASRVLADVTSRATDACSILYSDIVFKDGELLSFSENPSDYYDRINYVIGLYSIIETQKEFELLALDCVKTLQSAQDFTFGKITLCAGNAESAKFFVTVTPDTSTNEISSLVGNFKDGDKALYTITEKEFLQYWN